MRSLGQLIARLSHEHTRLGQAIQILREYEKSPILRYLAGHPYDQLGRAKRPLPAKRPVHWTQRPENAEQLRKTVQRMVAARQRKAKVAKRQP